MIERIAVSRPFLPGSGIARLGNAHAIRVWTHEAPPSTEELAAFVGDAEIAVTVKSDHITAEFLEACPNLRFIALMSAGYDTIDTGAVVAHDVVVSHAPGVLHHAAADLTFGLMLNARRLVRPSLAMLHSGDWHTLELHEMLGLDVYGATLGIVGFGEIGHELAARAKGFSMAVQHYDIAYQTSSEMSVFRPLDELLQTSDIVSLHVPLFLSTRHLIGARELGLMKSTATLVNASRGPVVDQEALIDALRSGQIHSAGLDVFEVEPILEIDHPLLTLPNVFATPHIASATESARAAMVNCAVDNVFSYLDSSVGLTPIPECRALDSSRSK